MNMLNRYRSRIIRAATANRHRADLMRALNHHIDEFWLSVERLNPAEATRQLRILSGFIAEAEGRPFHWWTGAIAEQHLISRIPPQSRSPMRAPASISPPGQAG